ncbi:hypothetical protein ACLOJK_000132 [Asimina triloba]
MRFNQHPRCPPRRIPVANIRSTVLPLPEILRHGNFARSVSTTSIARCSATPKMHEREAIPRGGREALPPLLPLPAGEVLDRPGDILSGLGILHAAVSEVAGGGGALGGGEDAELVEELDAARDVKEGKNLGVADLDDNDEAVLLAAGYAGGFLEGEGGEGEVAVEGGDVGGVVVPETEAVAKDVEEVFEGEGLVRGWLGGGRRATEGLVELVRRGKWGRWGGEFGGGDGLEEGC